MTKYFKHYLTFHPVFSDYLRFYMTFCDNNKALRRLSKCSTHTYYLLKTKPVRKNHFHTAKIGHFPGTANFFPNFLIGI